MKRLTFLALALVACGGKKTEDKKEVGSGTDTPVLAAPGRLEGLELRVSEGAQGAPAFDRAKLAAATKLGDGDTQQLLTRAKPITVAAADKQAFALRPKSNPPPQTGTKVTGAFPPPASSLRPPLATDGALTVLRYMPEGQVPLAPELTVTFSQPMVAVTSQGGASAAQPVKLTPQPKGEWRWLGTRTIVFDPDVRFPQATTYAVEIPAGTKSATGQSLATATKFTFETPPVSIATRYPGGGTQRRDVPMFVLFDQKIDPIAVMSNIRVKANGNVLATRTLEPDEIAKDPQIAALVASARKDQDGRWLAFRARDQLPADTEITVEIAAGTTSAEGPNATKAPQQYTFRTFPPLALQRAECSRSECRPGDALRFTFNNELDAAAFSPESVALVPALPDAKITVNGPYLTVYGATTARTQYTVTLPSSLRDAFGQTLGADTVRAFSVGDARPTFFGPSGLVVADPAAPAATLAVFSTNYKALKTRLYQVAPTDWDAYGRFQREQWNKDKPPPPPGKRVLEAETPTTGGENKLVETAIALAPGLPGKLGHVLAIVEPTPWTEKSPPPQLVAWVQVTRLAVQAHVDNENLVAFVTDLATGAPIANAELELRPSGLRTTTDATGLATLALPAAGSAGAHYLIARKGADSAFVTENAGWYNDTGSWVRRDSPRRLAWYVIDDRKMYKPGEEVSLKGWLRLIDQRKGGDVEAVGAVVPLVTYVVKDARNNQLATGTAVVNTLGGFDARFTLPRTPNLGAARIELSTPGNERHYHTIEVQEFRRPEFEVTAQASAGPFLVGESGDVTVSAKYYAGGPLPGAATRWDLSASVTTFSPPNRDEYTFGTWTPWWGRGGDCDDCGDARDGIAHGPSRWSLEGKTDGSGAHTLHLDFLGVHPAVPMSVVASASVTDVNRQSWTASAPLLVHPSQYYVGLRAKRPFVDQGVPYEVDVLGVDVEGNIATGAKIDVTSVRLDTVWEKGRYQVKEVEAQVCSAIAAAQPAHCAFGTQKGGAYRITAKIVDGKGRANTSTLQYWVAGGQRVASREVTLERVEMIPDKKAYAAGATAEILVLAPFTPAEGVVTYRRLGIVKTQRITLTKSSTVITVPITDDLVPNLDVQVDLVGAAPRLDAKGQPAVGQPPRPAYASGSLTLAVPPTQRTLTVSVVPTVAKVAPGETATIAVQVKDAAGAPVAGAEAALIVVDEAILALTGYQFPDPLDAFYAPLPGGVRDVYEHAYIELARPDAAGRNNAPPAEAEAAMAPGAVGGMAFGSGMGIADGRAASMKMSRERPNDGDGLRLEESARGGEASTTPIAIRANFNPLAAFSPSMKTDASGKATLQVKMPDNLTRYRVIAVAVAGGKQFGKGESALTARLPLMVRPSPPRFLNFGDTFELPVVIQNQTDAPMDVKVAVRTTNALLSDGAGRAVRVPPNDRVEVRFPAAAELAGTARFQIVASVPGYADAAEVALPVWTPATTEAFATYGVVDDGATSQPVALPEKVVETFGGLEVSTASTNLQALTDAFLYIVQYPFECAEQRSSRILSIAALRDVLTAFDVPGLPTPAALAASVAADLERLAQMQNVDGGFAFWERGYPSEPYLTVHVANALVRAQGKGYAVPPAMLERAKTYLREIEQHYPTTYGPEIRFAISAYALATRRLMGDLDVAKGQKLLADAGGASKVAMEPLGWLLATFAQQPAAAAERKAIVTYAMNHVSETAGAANFTTGYGDGAYLILSSDRRVDAVMLEALIQENPALDLIPKLVTGLLAHQKAGRWLNTQENAFALLALDLYFRTYEKVTPNFVARVWLGADYAGDHAFKGRTTETFAINIPMKDVVTHDSQALTIQKDGAGRLYYRIGMTYAPASLALAPADYGFVVTRAYEWVDNASDVTRDAQGVWHVKAGARVRVKLTMVNENRRYHVALVDPLPAGLEAINPALAVSGPTDTGANLGSDPLTTGKYDWWYRTWYEHQNLRDERTEAFTQLLWAGVHRYEYVARATTPGNFIVPPTKAEEMYMPETFGRSGSDRLIVE